MNNKMTKYAIVPINIKQIDEKLYLRCVLISYEKMNGLVFEGTKFLDCSPYFNDVTKALQYKFEDSGYTLICDNHGKSRDLSMIKRPYHTHVVNSLVDDRLGGTTFECNIESEAIKLFRRSEYYDCDSNPIIMKK